MDSFLSFDSIFLTLRNKLDSLSQTIFRNSADDAYDWELFSACRASTIVNIYFREFPALAACDFRHDCILGEIPAGLQSASVRIYVATKLGPECLTGGIEPMKKRFLTIAIVASCSASLAVQTPEPQATGTLRGVVINDTTNEPISGVIISIGRGNTDALILQSAAQTALNENARDSEARSRLLEFAANSIAGFDTGREFNTVTDKDGRFSIETIPSGDYPVAAVLEGYAGIENINDHTDRMKDPFVTRARTTIAVGETTEVVLKMIPTAVLSGRIVDRNGNVLSNATVEVLIRIDKDGIPSAELFSTRPSNDRGEFRVFQLPPGEYLLSATPSTSSSQRPESDMRTFYPGTADLHAATPVKLRPGEDLPGINIQIGNSPGPIPNPAPRSQE